MNTDKIYAESLANEYAPKDTSKVIALKKLDQKAKLPAIILAYATGISGALMLGIGMCLSMQIIGSGSLFMKGFGIFIGIQGIALVAINYPMYKKILKRNKEKYAFEIMELAKEIVENN